jgi:hypothetical protein
MEVPTMTTRSLLALSLVLAAVALAAPARAAEPAGPVPPFLAPPACSAAAASPFKLPQIPELTPEPGPLACTADLSCPDGCYIACQGNSICEVGSTWVKCDGVQTNCPYPGCGAPTNCLNPCGFCECRAAGFGVWQCTRAHCLDCWPPISCL